MSAMKEKEPVGGCLKGAWDGLVIFIFLCICFAGIGLFVFAEMFSVGSTFSFSSVSYYYHGYYFLAAAVVFLLFAVYAAVSLLRKIARALMDENIYYWIGMVSLVLIPLLFFGSCVFLSTGAAGGHHP